ncbi:DUF3606 domain-containing protein [Bradyrhizobium sp. 147]|uniref:DUF3606 domain-containing protein n=1 Tax=unclassified Bradyrhizobium TaxID=2631580 RepID=UPI001FFA081C|nr:MULTISPECIES: DUF3606 domain-containing protein [unclassified Bradyrhizobium]MCK1541130.1 DUF3606 domain-containing protein [Bradyrhizobium sp. 179]MCK1624653.1 DUF3606 domain-containing protein [Bradyrhizobium sp. 160]MCK1683821.1 DUF3606 domain-containing protein [Bradyrhizobium sp. 147]
MQRSKPQPIRNKLDLTDRTQVRHVRKRLRLSDAELIAIVGRIGNSISAISKEATLQKASVATQAADALPAAVVACAPGTEQTATEPLPTAPVS